MANDTVATKDWLDIMLRCADSDANIAAVVPATCNMSNYLVLAVANLGQDAEHGPPHVGLVVDDPAHAEAFKILPHAVCGAVVHQDQLGVQRFKVGVLQNARHALLRL